MHLTKDGELVVTHDEEISRVSNGSGFVRDHTLSALKELRFNRTHPEYADARIPTLREVYELLLPLGLTVNVELKNSSFLYPGMEEACIDLAARMGMTDPGALLLLQPLQPAPRDGGRPVAALRPALQRHADRPLGTTQPRSARRRCTRTTARFFTRIPARRRTGAASGCTPGPSTARRTCAFAFSAGRSCDHHQLPDVPGRVVNSD